MKTSENTGELFKAFVAAQAELKNAVFDKVNPHFKSKYATLAGMRDGIVATLSKHGLAIIQGTSYDETTAAIDTRLVHTSGQWIESRYPLQVDAPQKMGSAVTYARRYSLAAMCGIASEEDDDGNAASEPNKAKPVTASKATSRDDFDRMVKEIRNIASLKALRQWGVDNEAATQALPSDWFDDLTVEYTDKQNELKKVLAV